MESSTTAVVSQGEGVSFCGWMSSGLKHDSIQMVARQNAIPKRSRNLRTKPEGWASAWCFCVVTVLGPSESGHENESCAVIFFGFGFHLSGRNCCWWGGLVYRLGLVIWFEAHPFYSVDNGSCRYPRLSGCSHCGMPMGLSLLSVPSVLSYHCYRRHSRHDTWDVLRGSSKWFCQDVGCGDLVFV